MELRQLRAFLTVVEQARAGRAQAGATNDDDLQREVRRLERELGVELFDLAAPGRLSRSGSFFLDEARRLIDRTEQAAATTRRVASDGPGLTVGYDATAAADIVATVVDPLLDAAPDASIGLVAEDRSALIDGLFLGRLDAVVIRGPVHRRGVVAAPLGRATIRLAVPVDHPLEHRPVVDLIDLADEPLVISARRTDPALFDEIVAACHRSGFEPKVTTVVDRPELVLTSVVCGQGIGIVPAATMQTWGQSGVVSRPVAGAPVWDVIMARLGSATAPALLELWDRAMSGVHQVSS